MFGVALDEARHRHTAALDLALSRACMPCYSTTVPGRSERVAWIGSATQGMSQVAVDHTPQFLIEFGTASPEPAGSTAARSARTGAAKLGRGQR